MESWSELPFICRNQTGVYRQFHILRSSLTNVILSWLLSRSYLNVTLTTVHHVYIVCGWRLAEADMVLTTYSIVSREVRIPDQRTDKHAVDMPATDADLVCFHHIHNCLTALRAWQSSRTTSLQVNSGLPLALEYSTSYSMHFFTQSCDYDHAGGIIFFSQHMPIPSQPVLLQYQCYVIYRHTTHTPV